VAETFGLKCLEQSGGLASLRNTNRPAVLKLKTLGDKAFYITVTGVGDESIAAEINGKREVIPVAELNSLWQGEFTIFWRAPPNYKGPIVPGSRGPDVLWLANQVALIVGRKLSKDENREYDTSLTEDVKAFQSAQGLTADGIAGSLTLIHLNSEVFEDTPMLSSGSGISANPG
jgi:general secretion pathway protein A